MADRSSMEAMLTRQYPSAYRLAAGLCGNIGAASTVAARVLNRATVMAPRWNSDLEAERWLLRFTILAARQIDVGWSDDVELARLNPLPMQQREAVALIHGLQLDLHRAAAAMDCSSSAAANHLVLATAQLRATGPADDWIAALPARLADVVPPEAIVVERVVKAVARRRWRAWGRRAFIVVMTAAAIAAGWAGWHLWRMLVI